MVLHAQTRPDVFAGIHLRLSSRSPLHRQLESSIRALIRRGQVRPGDVVPPELNLARQLGVSRHTVRHALSALVAEGWLMRKRGVGTTVLNRSQPGVIERSLGQFYAFAWEAQSRGAEHRSFVLERLSIAADNAIAARLHLPPGDPVERIERLRTANDEPLVLETTYLPSELATGLDWHSLERQSLYDELERLHNLVTTHAHETIRPVVLEDDAAALLSVSPGSPAFLVERHTWAGNRPIEWQHSLVRGDRFLYSVALTHRAASAE